ncbi:hypothetical protein MTP99_008077 [Tenebrio molitor]|nr:hypothetical protein MTP99_008077 [Tenebrio molitor]
MVPTQGMRVSPWPSKRRRESRQTGCNKQRPQQTAPGPPPLEIFIFAATAASFRASTWHQGRARPRDCLVRLHQIEMICEEAVERLSSLAGPALSGWFTIS